MYAVAVFFCLQGCDKQQPPAGEAGTDDKATEPAVKKTQYANDLDRLDQLTDRINRACRGSYVVVPGAGDSASGGLVSVNYTLFDKLSDDGTAVLIAEAIAVRSNAPLQMQGPTEGQTKANIAKVVLQADETVGRYIAGAGFSSAGFTEWLKARRLSSAGSQQDGVPEKMRIAAFMRGYLSASVKKGYR